MMPWVGDDDHEAKICRRRWRVVRTILCHPFRDCIPRRSSASSSSYSLLVLLVVVLVLVVVIEVAIGMLRCHRRTPHWREHPISISMPLPQPHRAAAGVLGRE